MHNADVNKRPWGEAPLLPGELLTDEVIKETERREGGLATWAGCPFGALRTSSSSVL